MYLSSRRSCSSPSPSPLSWFCDPSRTRARSRSTRSTLSGPVVRGRGGRARPPSPRRSPTRLDRAATLLSILVGVVTTAGLRRGQPRASAAVRRWPRGSSRAERGWSSWPSCGPGRRLPQCRRLPARRGTGSRRRPSPGGRHRRAYGRRPALPCRLVGGRPRPDPPDPRRQLDPPRQRDAHRDRPAPHRHPPPHPRHRPAGAAREVRTAPPPSWAVLLGASTAGVSSKVAERGMWSSAVSRSRCRIRGWSLISRIPPSRARARRWARLSRSSPLESMKDTGRRSTMTCGTGCPVAASRSPVISPTVKTSISPWSSTTVASPRAKQRAWAPGSSVRGRGSVRDRGWESCSGMRASPGTSSGPPYTAARQCGGRADRLLQAHGVQVASLAR